MKKNHNTDYMARMRIISK